MVFLGSVQEKEGPRGVFLVEELAESRTLQNMLAVTSRLSGGQLPFWGKAPILNWPL